MEASSSGIRRVSPSTGSPANAPRPNRPAAGETEALLRRYAQTRNLETRNQLVAAYDRLVRYVAGRFAPSGGNSPEDLVQVGYLGLISALDRYDPSSGVSFITFATPTILGVIKHHLRDTGWMVKAPRRLRELGVKVRRLNTQLEQRLGRPPTIPELAEAAGVEEERLLHAMEVEKLYQSASLDAPATEENGDGVSCLWEALGRDDDAISEIQERDWVASALEGLEERERSIIFYRYFGEASQAEVARRLGISQMHVSRLERRAIARLRELLS